jgi:ABC-type oligopeptide transport system ATPase subunit
MYLGEIVEIGSRQAVFENPQHDYTKRLMAAVPIADPSRGGRSRRISNEEIKSPYRPGRLCSAKAPGMRSLVRIIFTSFRIKPACSG